MMNFSIASTSPFPATVLVPTWCRGTRKCPTQLAPFADGRPARARWNRSLNCTALAFQATGRKSVQLSEKQEQSILGIEDDILKEVDPEFFRMGFVRHVRAYGVAFKEGPNGIGVYAARDMNKSKSARLIMEIPLELMITVTKESPWMFFPDFVPIGHPIFEVINSTDEEKDWDFRLACLLLLALDQNDHFWYIYSDYLPGNDDLTSLLLATEYEKHELQDKDLEQVVASQKKRAGDFWKQNWPSDSMLKLKRLAQDEDQFLWALGVVWSRKFLMNITIGAKASDVHMLIPYADMLNHSFQPTCSCRWRRKDRMLEVVINRGQSIKKGDEMTLNYSQSVPSDTLMEYYGFSAAVNPFEKVNFSGNAKIHRDSFLSAFNFSGVYHDPDYQGDAQREGRLLDGAIVAAAQNFPMWSDADFPFLPSQEIKAAQELKLECRLTLETYPTTLEEDHQILKSGETKSAMWRAAVKYRMDRKRLLQRLIEILDQYAQRILF